MSARLPHQFDKMTPLASHGSSDDAHAFRQPCYFATENAGVAAFTLPGRQDESTDVADT